MKNKILNKNNNKIKNKLYIMIIQMLQVEEILIILLKIQIINMYNKIQNYQSKLNQINIYLFQQILEMIQLVKEC